MRCAFISDLHANLAAWEAVAGDINRQGVDRLVCLGDTVGYGPWPEEVVTSVREACDEVLLGNHDAVACGRMETEGFSAAAVRSLAWTRERLSRESLDFLHGLPLVLNGEGFACVHAEGSDPAAFYYLESEEDARATWAAMPQPLILVGHTHVPAIHRLDNRGRYQRMDPSGFGLQPDCRYLVNVGSVGLPRNRDYRASYVIYDSRSSNLSWHLVPYRYEEHLQQVRERTGGSDEAEWLYREYLKMQGLETGGLGAARSDLGAYRPDKAILVRAPSRRRVVVASAVSRSKAGRFSPAARPGPTSRRRWGPGMLWAVLMTVLVGGLLTWDWFFNPHPYLQGVRQRGVPAPRPYVSPLVGNQPDVLLTELEPVKAVSGQGDIAVNRAAGGSPMRMEGDTFTHGLGVTAVSDLVYSLEASHRRFMAVIGLDDGVQWEKASSVVFEVWAEGPGDDFPVRLYKSSVFRNDGLRRASLELEIPAGAQRIRLHVGDAGDGAAFDHANWANAGFLLEP